MKLLLMSGGRHPYEESTPVLESFLRAAGHDVTVREDASVHRRQINMKFWLLALSHSQDFF